MFNLLKSDLYRLVHGKMLWVMLAVTVALAAFTAAVVNFAATTYVNYVESGTVMVDSMGLSDEDLAEFNDALDEAMSELDESEVEAARVLTAETSDTFTDVDMAKREVGELTTLFGQSLAGGELAVLVSLMVALFFSADFDTHYIRNLVMDRAGRRRYYAEKLLLAALMSAGMLLVGMVAILASFAVAGFGFNFTENAASVALWVLLAWLTTTVYAWMTAVVVWATRSRVAGTLMALIVSMGLVGSMLMLMAANLGWSWPWLGELVHWIPYSNQSLLNLGSPQFDLTYGSALAANGSLSVPQGAIAGLSGLAQAFIVAALWLAACAALTFAVLRRRDV